MTIWKYPLKITDQQILQGPIRQVLTVQVQHGQPVLWALVTPSSVPVKLSIRMFGTGHSVPETEALSYISTFQVDDGAYVFHVFKGEVA